MSRVLPPGSASSSSHSPRIADAFHRVPGAAPGRRAVRFRPARRVGAGACGVGAARHSHRRVNDQRRDAQGVATVPSSCTPLASGLRSRPAIRGHVRIHSQSLTEVANACRILPIRLWSPPKPEAHRALTNSINGNSSSGVPAAIEGDGRRPRSCRFVSAPSQGRWIGRQLRDVTAEFDPPNRPITTEGWRLSPR